MTTAVTTRTALAKLLGISRPRLTQYSKMGLPIRPDRLVDQEEALAWVAESIDSPVAERARALLAATTEAAAPAPEAAAPLGRRGNGSGGITGTAGLTHERTQVARERAALLRLQRRELEGDLAPVADLGDAMRTMVLTLRSAALGLPSKVAPRMVMLRTVGEAQKILDSAIREWLEELASARIYITRRSKPPDGWEDYIEFREPQKR
jgi:phage terminase Nu1 subunit (DNA packaging protein)